ncbi:peptidoglycan DD-metalloendopeptidase family protein [Nocardioides sp. Bht2]|uniref:peptidoglycan DD-metalloendopeptidase family protein n=1 Tax=Nocardioides sp. Bht2 TaxID=3392297 RepID=UPI0039B68B27
MSRFFPSGHRNRLAALAVSASLVVGAVAPFAFADDLKDKQREVEKKVQAAHNDLDESSAQLRKATIALRNANARLSKARADLASTRAQLAAAQAKDARMQTLLAKAEEELTAAQEDVRQGRMEVRYQQADVDRMGAAQYEQGDPRLEGYAALLNAEDLADVARAQEATRAATTEQDAILIGLREAQELLKLKKEQVAQKRDEVETRRVEAAANLALMKRLETRAVSRAERVASTRSARRGAAAQAQAARRADRKALAALEADQARIERILRNRAAKHQGTPSNSGGFLNHPVNGYVTSPYGYRIHPIYGYRSLHNGVDFGAACGTPMYASANGTVLSRYYQDAWGNRLIIDHGGARGVGLATIYNHASSYVVSPGERVKRGQLIGYVGTTGWSTGCHLHFIVMANGTPVDPMKWF